jgi:hypothetical protein
MLRPFELCGMIPCGLLRKSRRYRGETMKLHHSLTLTS